MTFFPLFHTQALEFTRSKNNEQEHPIQSANPPLKIAIYHLQHCPLGKNLETFLRQKTAHEIEVIEWIRPLNSHLEPLVSPPAANTEPTALPDLIFGYLQYVSEPLSWIRLWAKSTSSGPSGSLHPLKNRTLWITPALLREDGETPPLKTRPTPIGEEQNTEILDRLFSAGTPEILQETVNFKSLVFKIDRLIKMTRPLSQNSTPPLQATSIKLDPQPDTPDLTLRVAATPTDGPASLQIPDPAQFEPQAPFETPLLDVPLSKKPLHALRAAWTATEITLDPDSSPEAKIKAYSDWILDQIEADEIQAWSNPAAWICIYRSDPLKNEQDPSERAPVFPGSQVIRRNEGGKFTLTLPVLDPEKNRVIAAWVFLGCSQYDPEFEFLLRSFAQMSLTFFSDRG